LALVIPLAAEEIYTVEVWDKLSSVILTHEHRIQADRFEYFSNICWAFSKSDYEGKFSKQMWQLIEQQLRV